MVDTNVIDTNKLNKEAQLNIADLLQQTIDQTVLVTTHNLIDYICAYMKQRNDYQENQELFDELILVMRKIEKRYEVKADGKDNGKVNSDHNQ